MMTRSCLFNHCSVPGLSAIHQINFYSVDIKNAYKFYAMDNFQNCFCCFANRLEQDGQLYVKYKVCVVSIEKFIKLMKLIETKKKRFSSYVHTLPSVPTLFLSFIDVSN